MDFQYRCCMFVDSIEDNVEQAVVHVEEANVQLQREKHYQVFQLIV